MPGQHKPRLPAAIAFGAELRRLRGERGLSQRALTRLIGLSAHSNIADYETGRRIPPRDIVTECERQLADTDGRLSALHSRALAERARMGEGAGALPQAPQPAPSERVAGLRRWLAHVMPVRRAVSVALVALSLGPPLWLFTSDDARPVSVAPTPSPSAVTPFVWDGNDPKSSGCAADAISLDIHPVRLTAAVGSGPATLPAGTLIGLVSLRYSPRCAVAWGKFEPNRVMADPRPVAVIVEALRPADGMRTVFQYPGLVQTYGDMLRTGPGCVRVSAAVVFAGTRTTAEGSTACLSDPSEYGSLR